MADDLNIVGSQHALVLQAWQCLIGDATVTYVSGPITTGLRWLQAIEADKDPGRSVIDANCESIKLAARHLRNERQGLVLEPSSLHVESWSQDDYLALWTTLIERHASAVAFIEGWSYSIGCALEFEHAVNQNIVTTTLDGQPIARAAGAMLIQQAAEDVMARLLAVPAAVKLAKRLSAVASRLVTDTELVALS